MRLIKSGLALPRRRPRCIGRASLLDPPQFHTRCSPPCEADTEGAKKSRQLSFSIVPAIVPAWRSWLRHAAGSFKHLNNYGFTPMWAARRIWDILSNRRAPIHCSGATSQPSEASHAGVAVREYHAGLLQDDFKFCEPIPFLVLRPSHVPRPFETADIRLMHLQRSC